MKVLDFGLAKLAPDGRRVKDATRSMAGATPGRIVLGTFTYMAPEQARGLGRGCARGLFALGVVLYEMVTGRAPFKGDTRSDVVGRSSIVIRAA